jgi:L-threonylcarbamoyladenylate synthase
MGTIDEAVSAIRAGEPVILPTDTVYGLCATPYREGPVARLYALKGRPETVPSALLCCDLDLLFECVPELRGRSGVLARAVLPGAYTLIFPNPARRFRWLNGLAVDTIGVRVPLLEGPGGEVLDQVGAVAATSANRHRGLDPRRLEDVPSEISSACGAVVDGGELPGKPSTVIDLSGPEPHVVREGAGSVAAALERLAAVAV